MMPVKVGVLPWPPGAMPCFLDDHCPLRGYGIDATQLVCQYLHLNCTFLLYNGTEFGDYNETSGEVTGILGAISRDEFDTSVPLFTPTFRRFEAMQFSSIYFYTNLLMATNAPESKWGQSNLNILHIFNWSIWLTLFIGFLIISGIIAFSSKKTGRSGESILYLFLQTILSLLANCHEAPYWEYSTLRPMLISWLYSSVVLIASFTGFLFSNRVTYVDKVPFTDLESFVDCLYDGKCHLILSASSASFMQLITSTDSLSDRVNDALKRNPPRVATDDRIPEIILNNQNDIHLVWPGPSISFFYHAQGYPDCSFYTVQAPYKVFGAFPFRKRSPLQRALSEIGPIFLDFGLATSMQAKYDINDGSEGCNRAQQQTSETFTPASLLTMASLFEFYCIGVLICLGIFGVELGMYRWWNGFGTVREVQAGGGRSVKLENIPSNKRLTTETNLEEDMSFV